MERDRDVLGEEKGVLGEEKGALGSECVKYFGTKFESYNVCILGQREYSVSDASMGQCKPRPTPLSIAQYKPSLILILSIARPN
jgi:hypothetical protein